MFELKIQSNDGKSSFGWTFKTEQEAADFLAELFSKDNCPYAPIVERDEEGNVVSTSPNPDWTIEVLDNTQADLDRVKKDEAVELAKTELKGAINLVALAKDVKNESDIKQVLVQLAESVLRISKVLGISGPLEGEAIKSVE